MAKTNIQTLLESSNEYKSQQKEAERLVKKWAASGLLEGLSKRSQGTVAVMLENQAKQIIAEANATNIGGAHFTAGEGEQWAGVALPLVRKVFGQIAAKDFLSVQTMNLPSGPSLLHTWKACPPPPSVPSTYIPSGFILRLSIVSSNKTDTCLNSIRSPRIAFPSHSSVQQLLP